MRYVSFVENGIHIDVNKLKEIIICEWASEKLYQSFYKKGLRGESLYNNILAWIAAYADDLDEEAMELAKKRLNLTGDYCFDSVDSYPKSDIRSIGMEVCTLLRYLWCKPIEKVTAEDIPVILEFLDTPPDKTLEAWDKWEKYWANLDYPARRKKLLEDPKYN